jgi:hypothetical protein
LIRYVYRFPATLFKQLFRPEDAFLAARIAFCARANLARAATRFVVTLKSSIAPIQGVACVSSSRLLMQHVKYVQ